MGLINNPDFENYLGRMYPPELEIKDTTGITPIFDPITDLDLITELDFLPNCERFP